MTTEWIATGGWWRYRPMNDFDYVDILLPMMRLVKGHRQDGSLLIKGKVLACSVSEAVGNA